MEETDIRKVDNSGMLLLWRVVVIILALMAMIFASVAVAGRDTEETSSDYGCPLFPAPSTLVGWGKAVGEGERCMYRDGDTWPLCRNSYLPDTHKKEDQLRCVHHKCEKLLGGGGNCTMYGRPHHDWCESGVCAPIEHGTNIGGFVCKAEHFRSHVKSTCSDDSWCSTEMYCTGGECATRLSVDAPCTEEDAITGRTPFKSHQCVHGSFCQRRSGGGPLLCTDKNWGAEGQSCPWLTGQPRPLCARGRLFCSVQQVCTKLAGENEACSYVVGATDNDVGCGMGLACHVPNTAGLSGTHSGTCKRVGSLKAGEETSSVRFCEPGLVVELGFCTEPRNLNIPCATDADCGAGLMCGCATQHSTAKPGVCQKPPLRLPAVENKMPVDLLGECASDFTPLAAYMSEWWKSVDPENAGGFEVKKGELEVDALCCMKKSGKEWSHAWLQAAGYMINIDEAEITCNGSTLWVYILLSVTLGGTIFGVCALICTSLKQGAEGEDSVPMIVGEVEMDCAQQDRAEERMTQYVTSPAIPEHRLRTPGVDPAASPYCAQGAGGARYG